MACGPSKRVVRYTGCIVQGYKFHTMEHKRNQNTQNRGVLVEGSHVSEDIDYHGIDARQNRDYSAG